MYQLFCYLLFLPLNNLFGTFPHVIKSSQSTLCSSVIAVEQTTSKSQVIRSKLDSHLGVCGSVWVTLVHISLSCSNDQEASPSTFSDKKHKGTYSTGTLQISANFTPAHAPLVRASHIGKPEVKGQGSKPHHLWRNYSYMEKGVGIRREVKFGANNAIFRKAHFECQTHWMFTNYLFTTHTVLCASCCFKCFTNI